MSPIEGILQWSFNHNKFSLLFNCLIVVILSVILWLALRAGTGEMSRLPDQGARFGYFSHSGLLRMPHKKDSEVFPFRENLRLRSFHCSFNMARPRLEILPLRPNV